MATLVVCSIEGCGKRVCARGWCDNHYKRWLKHGTPTGGKTSRGEPPRFLREIVLAYEGDECLFWPFGKNSGGYGTIRHNGSTQLVSRIVCEHLFGPAPTPGHHAAHSCGRGHLGCVSPRHLRWATRLENTSDMIVHGTKRYWANMPKTKLTPDCVRAIRALRGTLSRTQIAERFGVSKITVDKVTSRRSWRWLD